MELSNKVTYFTNVLTPACPFLIKDILDSNAAAQGATVLIVENEKAIQSIQPIFLFLGVNSLIFPEYDVKEYDFISPSRAVIFQRFQTLFALTNTNEQKNIVIITTPKAIVRKVHSKKRISCSIFLLKIHTNIARERIILYLTTNGYTENTMAIYAGDFAVRGSIIDIVLQEKAIRIDFFGNQIESIKTFDVITQGTLECIDEAELFPVAEIEANTFSDKLQSNHPLHKSFLSGVHYPGEENWLSTFYDDLVTFFDYISGGSNLVFFTSARSPLATEIARISALFTAHCRKEYCYKDLNSNFCSEEIFSRYTNTYSLYYFHELMSFAHNDCISNKVDNIEKINSTYNKIVVHQHNIVDILAFWELDKKPIIFCALSKGALSVLGTTIKREFNIIKSIDDMQAINGALIKLEESFYLDNRFLMINGQDIIGKEEGSAKQNKDFLIREVFEVGELVVHKNHGVARFEGLTNISLQNSSHECVKLIYQDGDKLFVPIENIKLITKYGKGDAVKLDKLGGFAWQLKREKVKQHIQLISDELIKRAASRQISEGIQIEGIGEKYERFCAKFPYTLTIDQKNAAQHVIEDLSSNRVMDRLISGDTGFGKTEVLLRAAFATINQDSSFQVAIITPTKMLCNQHFKVFQERFEGFNCIIEQLSGKNNAKESNEIKARLRSGKINIVIGTHAIIKCTFKNLALIIIDEEHCFGVKQKEELKKLGNNIHILTASATPIPRTLQMSLSGIKSLSTIKSPPFERILPNVCIIDCDEIIIKEAILREYNRGGKVFCVVPKISQIEGIIQKLSSILPKEVLIKSAHGEMKADYIEELMCDFYENKFSVLLSTTIIQAGIDIPTANTMIIFNAEMFGMATLYQLRGRVGRGKVSSFVYFIVENCSEDARKRLQSIASISKLGSSVDIAAHDMDIRGFGNLIGEKQSGKIKDVGIELYQKMLHNAMSMATPYEDIVVNVPLPIGIPANYIEDFKVRLEIYNTLSSLQSIQEINLFSVEIIDRFGDPIPQELQNLLQITHLQHLCADVGIKQIDILKRAISITFDVENAKDIKKILQGILKIPQVSIKANDRILITRNFANHNEALNASIKEAQHIKELIVTG